MAAFNSDGLDFSDREDSPSHARVGAKSIQLIFEHAAADRVTSKKIVKQLKFSDGGIAPGTRLSQSLWMNRFDSLWTAWGQDVTQPYNIDDIIRFFVAIIRKSLCILASFFLNF